ncbi:MAG: hypothetical protein ABJL99_10025 [Aliishimia sp.]
MELTKLKSCVELLLSVTPEARLTSLKNLVVNNGGFWTVPETTDHTKPVLYEANLHGVPAFASDPEALPRNWIRAANNALNGLAS